MVSSSEKSEERTIRIGGNGHAFAPDLIASGRPGPTTDRPSFPGARFFFAVQNPDSNRCWTKQHIFDDSYACRQFLRPIQNLDVAFFVPTVSSESRFNSSPPSTSGGSPRLTQRQHAILFQPYGAFPINVFAIHPPHLVRSGACFCLFLPCHYQWPLAQVPLRSIRFRWRSLDSVLIPH